MEALNRLIRRRAFWAALLAWVFLVVVEFVPSLADNVGQVTETALLVISMLVGGWAVGSNGNTSE